MSTHGCFAPPFPPFINAAIRCWPQESAATADGYYYTDGAFYYMEDADAQE
jgi:hypothetical protein